MTQCKLPSGRNVQAATRFSIAETILSFDGSTERSTSVFTSVGVWVRGYAKLFGMHELPDAVLAVYAVFIRSFHIFHQAEGHKYLFSQINSYFDLFKERGLFCRQLYKFTCFSYHQLAEVLVFSHHGLISRKDHCQQISCLLQKD